MNKKTCIVLIVRGWWSLLIKFHIPWLLPTQKDGGEVLAKQKEH
jgi:hypothetical protein